jgi:hypothetical protein
VLERAKDRAQEGLRLLKNAIVESLRNHPEGLTNAQLADQLELRSDYLGKHKGFLTWSVLGLLLNEKQISRKGRSYFVKK